jgi:4-hydroxy-tetrahydrodipicolinate reductase
MTPLPLKLLINGSRGRMGLALLDCIRDFPDLALGAAVDVGDDFNGALLTSDVVIDFSHHTCVIPLLESCVQLQKRVVIGTTGHTESEIATIRASASSIPIVFAANYSTGVNTLFWLARKAAEILGPGFDLEVIEMHHRLKKDSPSGTARRLAEILCEVRDARYAEDVRHGRHGMVGARTPEEIGMHAVRGGDVVGDHTVIFAANGERVELTHKASSRNTFASGALRAALWLRDQPPGLYDMEDVLGLRNLPALSMSET